MKQNIRTIIKQGYSFLITLPIFWIEESGLEEDGYVKVSLGKDGSLVLTPYQDEEEKEQEDEE